MKVEALKVIADGLLPYSNLSCRVNNLTAVSWHCMLVHVGAAKKIQLVFH